LIDIIFTEYLQHIVNLCWLWVAAKQNYLLSKRIIS